MNPKNNTKKKNIFNDESNSESEDDNQTENKKYATLKSQMPNTDPKSEIIPGVFLTNKQLYQILNKHGAQQSKSSNQEI